MAGQARLAGTPDETRGILPAPPYDRQSNPLAPQRTRAVPLHNLPTQKGIPAVPSSSAADPPLPPPSDSRSPPPSRLPHDSSPSPTVSLPPPTAQEQGARREVEQNCLAVLE